MKKQILLILASGLFTVNLYSQIDSVFSKKSLEEQINIIKSELIKDTIEFDKKDLIHRVIGTQNSDSYGKLYIINGKQFFKSDIVDRHCIEDFIKNYLKESNVISIEKLNSEVSAALYGGYGENGIVIIRLKKLKKAKTTQCNFELNRKLVGSNYYQPNGLMIRD
ncbi:MAG: Mor family transcriptional regulator [Saprospiraceae bacterium]|jgi:Mor family transcriptional regulator